MNSKTKKEALARVSEEAEAIIRESDPNEIERTKAAFSQLTDAAYYESMEMNKLHTVSAYCFDRFSDSATPMESWLLGAVTTAAQVGYLMGKGEF